MNNYKATSAGLAFFAMTCFLTSPTWASEKRFPLAQGLWAVDKKACGLENSPAAYSQYGEGVFLKIAGGTIDFYESSCETLRAQNEGGDSWNVQLACAGEGDTWEMDWRITKHDSNSFTDDSGTRYHLCP
jgi:hypothetical protein